MSRNDRQDTTPAEIVLYAERFHLLIAAAIQFALGGLLLFKLGTIGQYIGALLIGLGGWRVLKVIRIGFGQEGVIRLTASAVELPKQLCGDAQNTDLYTFSDLRNVFYIRRSLSWLRTGPVLIVETSKHVYRYPRDWFASDFDQRRAAAHLNARLGRALPSALVSSLTTDVPAEELSEAERRNRAVIFFIASGVLVMLVNLGLTASLRRFGISDGLLYLGAGLSIAVGLFYLLVPGQLSSSQSSPDSALPAPGSRSARTKEKVAKTPNVSKSGQAEKKSRSNSGSGGKGKSRSAGGRRTQRAKRSAKSKRK